jgi:4-hydroxy-tetrahydrodipicolinate reductase
MGVSIRIVVAGAAGRMGRIVVRSVLDDSECCLTGALEANRHPDLGRDAGTLSGCPPAGLSLTADARLALSAADALIDFTMPDVSVALSVHTAEMDIAHVIGTTGFSDAQERSIAAAARRITIVKSGNMSLGVTLLAALVERAAKALPEFDVEVVEMHHRMKTDAPSGTALLLGRAAAEGRGVALEAARAPARTGLSSARKPGEIGFASLRGGTVVGEHQVILAGAQERVMLGHVAEDRAVFASGAIAAAKWARTQQPGLYSMKDVLGIVG